MIARNRVFLDTSALFAAIWSATGGGRMLLKLGEVAAVQLFVSPHVLSEIENVLRRKAPTSLGVLTLLLDRSRVHVVPTLTSDLLEQSEALVHYRPDARVLAAAWAANVDYFVTLDRQHFLNNERLRRTVPFLIGTPGDCLSWYRTQFFK
jgi:predicted nucleic acid-binding protein